jgi:hypothetical protein
MDLSPLMVPFKTITDPAAGEVGIEQRAADGLP